MVCGDVWWHGVAFGVMSGGGWRGKVVCGRVC